MNVRKTNLTLWTLTTTLAVAAVVSAALGLLVPVDVAPDEAASPDRSPATTRNAPATAPSLDAFESVWALSLRKSLTDAPPAAAMASVDPGAAVAGPGGPFVLLGTIGNSLALIRTAAGAVEIKSVGEQFNGAKILAIRPSQVDVEIAGERRTLTKPREGSGG